VTIALSGGALLERETEIDRISAMVERVRDGAGATMLIAGPAGIGKTRLLDVAVGIAGAVGVAVQVARGGELERELPLGVVRQLLEPALLEASRSEHGRLLAGAAELGAAALRFEGRPSPRDAAGAAHGLYWLCANLADQTPRLLVIDDAQWADAASLRVLTYIARRLDGLALGLLMTVRSGEPAESDEPALAVIADEPGVELVVPAPLSHDAVSALLAYSLGEPRRKLGQACHEATGGNPFLVGEVARELRRAGEAASFEAVRPEHVGRTIVRRLRGLHPAAERVARAAAVLEDDAELRLVAALADGIDLTTAADAADALVAAELLRPGRPLRFTHPIVRAAVHAAMPGGVRARLHATAAEELAAAGADGDRVAVHLLHSEPEASEWALTVLRDAADRALGRGASAIAADLLERALREPPPAGQRVDVLLELGLAELQCGREGAIRHLREALELSTDQDRRAQVALPLAAALADVGAGSEAVALLDEIAQGADRELRLRIEARRALVARADLLTAPAARERIEQVVAGLDGKTEAERLALAVAASVATPNSAAATVDLCERALAGRDTMHDALEPERLDLIPVALMAAEHLDRAREVLEQMLATARARGSVTGFAHALTMRSFCSYVAGDLELAEADACTVLDTRGMESWGIAPAVAALLQVLVDRGALDEGQALLETHNLTGELPELMVVNALLHSRGRLRLASDMTEEGLADLIEIGTRHSRWGLIRPIPGWRAVAAEALARAGRHDQASALADENLAISETWGTPRAIGVALRTRALVRGGADVVDGLMHALAVLAESPSVLEHAQTLVEFGAALRRANHRSDAREPLRQALDVAERRGALTLAERARNELRATGARPRRSAVSGIASLTSSERRVAELAARGMTNTAIAQHLFVTVNTVETHMRHVFQKLNVGARTELAALIPK
jgi:DNA-binding CsgD family transcriptional regulator